MEKKNDASKNDFKVYNVYVKYVEMTMDDGDVLIYEAYSPFPKGHSIEKQLVKLSLKDAMNKINSMDDNDGLRMDHHGETAYAPSTVKKVKWSGDDDLARETYLIDITSSKDEHKLNSLIKIGSDNYKVSKVIDWVRNFNTKFAYCTKVLRVEKPDVIKAVEAAKEKE